MRATLHVLTAPTVVDARTGCAMKGAVHQGIMGVNVQRSVLQHTVHPLTSAT
jgi:hypothetical protein